MLFYEAWITILLDQTFHSKLAFTVTISPDWLAERVPLITNSSGSWIIEKLPVRIISIPGEMSTVFGICWVTLNPEDNPDMLVPEDETEVVSEKTSRRKESRH